MEIYTFAQLNTRDKITKIFIIYNMSITLLNNYKNVVCHTI